MADVDLRRTLSHIEALEREIGRVKRDVIRTLAGRASRQDAPTLFGTVHGEDVTDDMIRNAQRSLFRGS